MMTSHRSWWLSLLAALTVAFLWAVVVGVLVEWASPNHDLDRLVRNCLAGAAGASTLACFAGSYLGSRWAGKLWWPALLGGVIGGAVATSGMISFAVVGMLVPDLHDLMLDGSHAAMIPLIVVAGALGGWVAQQVSTEKVSAAISSDDRLKTAIQSRKNT